MLFLCETGGNQVLSKEVTYIDRNFIVSDYLPDYIMTLKEASNYTARLMRVLVNQMESKKWSGGAEEDFVVWRTPVQKIAKDIIVRASNNGIFDLTEKELINDNPAFTKLHDICSECMNKMATVLLQGINDWLEGYDKAYDSAASNITGPGFGVITNSFASAMLYEAVAYGALKQQARQADREFSNSLSKLSEKNQSKIDSENAKVLAVYYSNVKNVIPSIIANMMGVYFKKLDEKEKIKLSELQMYDMPSSDSILKNLEVVESKVDVLYAAFEKCPYNPNVFIKAANHGLLNEATFDTAKYLHQEEGLVEAVKEYFNPKMTVVDKEMILNSAKLIAHIKQKSLESVLNEGFANIVSKKVNEYSKLKRMIEDDTNIKTWIQNYITTNAEALCEYTNKDIVDSVKIVVNGIISEKTYDLYREIGVIKPEDISLEGSDVVVDLESINRSYIDKLATCIEMFIHELRIKRDAYYNALELSKNEKIRLENEKSELLDKRNKLSNIKIFTKREIDAKVIDLERQIARLDAKYNIRQLKKVYDDM